jgi:hypothetical protein
MTVQTVPERELLGVGGRGYARRAEIKRLLAAEVEPQAEQEGET